MNIPFLLGQALGAALLTGTFLFYMIKGFIYPKANWFYVVSVVYIPFIFMFYASYPKDLYDYPLINMVNALVFFAGIAGAGRYYWKRKKSSAHLK